MYFDESHRECLSLTDRLLDRFAPTPLRTFRPEEYREAVEACKRAGLISLRDAPERRASGPCEETTLRLNAAVDEYLAMPAHRQGDLKELAAKWDVTATAICYRMAKLHERRAEVRRTARNTYGTEVA